MRIRLSLRSKLLIFTVSVVMVLMGLSLAVIHRFVVVQVQSQVGTDLVKTQKVFDTFMRERGLWLNLSAGWWRKIPVLQRRLTSRTPIWNIRPEPFCVKPADFRVS
jgi:hypothetical protein